MKFQEQHEAFKRLVVQQGICKLEQFESAMPFGCTVPPVRIHRWFNNLLDLPTEFSAQKRYVNRFKVGADPEFVFVTQGTRMDARGLGLQQGLAFGMDNNGRLVEIRPYPSRSALNVVASILSTLRWMAVLKPETLKYEWTAGAWVQGDGIGGHVHFGRKRPGRDMEVKALDALDDELIAVRAYPVQEVARRRQGDGHGQHYGLPGDIRLQLHGYEYRSFPSWLDSPELAFLTITLSKLVVQNPELTQGYMPLISPDRHFQRIRNLLAYYKDTDDDARLALCMISKKLPFHLGGDFKKRWGIDGAVLGPTPAIEFIPSSVKPSVDEIKEVFQHLMGERPLLNRVPVPNWGPLVPLEGYEMVMKRTNTYGAKGLGELVWDVCQHKEFRHSFVSIKLGTGVFFSIPRSLAARLPEGWKKFCGERVAVHSDDAVIYSYEKSREAATFSECRRLLLETVFPFWKIGQIKSDSWEQWLAGAGKKKAPKPRWAGSLLFGAIQGLPLSCLR